MIQNIFSAVEPWRTARHHDAFVQTRAGLGYRSGLQIEIDVIRDEKIDVPVAVVVDESAACVPALAVSSHAGFFANVGEGAVPVVVVENIFSEVGDEEIVEPVVVVVADAHALPPAGMNQTGFGGDVGEGAVTIILEKMRKGFLSGGKAFEAPAVHEKNIQPAVVVVIVESDSTASGFEEIFIFVFATENSFGMEAGLASNVDEADPQIVRCGGRFESSPRGEGCEAPPAWPSECQDLVQW